MHKAVLDNPHRSTLCKLAIHNSYGELNGNTRLLTTAMKLMSLQQAADFALQFEQEEIIGQQTNRSFSFKSARETITIEDTLS